MLLAFFAFGQIGFGQQLLQWNTFSNTGNELTEPSIANDTNIVSANLTQGTITPAINGNRFGGREWFNTENTSGGNTLTEAIAGNDYIQFVVTPNSGFTFTPTSFTFIWDRSSSGPSNVTLRSSADGFTADLGSVTGLVSGGAATTTVRTINISGLNNISVPTTFRLYGYGATTTGGTGGFDCSVNAANVILNGTTIPTWTGAINNLWSEPGNWSKNTVPTGAEDVLIDSGTPILDQDFTIGMGKTLTVSGTGSLTINPANTLTIAGTADFGGKSITLKSDANGTASIGQVTGTVTGATNVTVERFITGRRAFRFLTPSVTTTTSIKANWQNGGATTPGIGTHITGSTTGATGFDATTTGNPSLFTYNAQIVSGTGFVNATNTDVATLNAGVGYRLLVRGDRNVDLTAAASADNMNAATTLSANGTLTVGNVTFDSTTGPALVNNQAGNTQTNGYTLIGNPYASPVDWNAVSKTGVANNAYYTWEPTIGTVAQRGRYVVYSADSGLTNLYDDNSALSQTNRRYLQTGQAVFIKNTVLATSATLTFNEANKASVNSYVFKTNQQVATTSGNSSLYLTVYDSNELAIGGNAIDGAAALFGTAYSNALDANDVAKLATSGENLAFVRENKNLAIETVAPVMANDELFVKTVQFQENKNYTFKVNTANFDTAVTAKMIDLYLNTETPIDLTQPSFVTFATTADANSYGANRFKILFSSAALGNESFNSSSVAIYPNPIANNEFTIALPNSLNGKVTVKVSNMLGQKVYSRTAEATTIMQVQPKQQLAEGVYVVSISNNGQVIQAKVIVKK